MKKLITCSYKTVYLTGLFILQLVFISTVYAASAVNNTYIINEYTETITPEANGDGLLTIAVTAQPNTDGRVFIVPSLTKIDFVELLAAQNLANNTLLAVPDGNLTGFNLQANDISQPLSFKAVFRINGFYTAKPVAESTGSPALPINYKFTNYANTQIGKYAVTIAIPAQTEFIKVKAPKAYAEFTLGMLDDMRTISINKNKLAPAAVIQLSFTFDTTVTDSALGKISIWFICLAIGLAVLIARLPPYPIIVAIRKLFGCAKPKQ